MIHDKSIVVGACDWEHPQWQKTFYPEDLPEDWRLSFYANEFSAVLVPASKWRAEDADFEQWAEDVGDDFRFYFLSDDVSVDDAQIKAELGKAFGGFVRLNGSDSVALICYQKNTLRQWKDWLLTAQCNARCDALCEAVFLMDDDLSVKQLSAFQSLVEMMGL